MTRDHFPPQSPHQGAAPPGEPPVPAGHLQGLLVGGGHGETHRGHHGLVAPRVDHLPLGPVSVTGQDALVVLKDGDLGRAGSTGHGEVWLRVGHYTDIHVIEEASVEMGTRRGRVQEGTAVCKLA